MKFFLAFCFALMHCLSATAQAPSALPANPTANQVANAGATSATLSFFNRPLITFRGELGGVSAPDRAQRAHARLKDQLDKDGPHRVSRKADAMGVLVQIDGATTFVVTEAEVDQSQQDTLETTAAKAQAALETAISQSKESRNLDAVLKAVAWSVAASAIAAAVWLALRQLGTAISRKLMQLSAEHATKLQVGGITLVNRNRVVAVVRGAITLVLRIMLFLVVYEWLSFVLRRFPFTRAWGEALNGYLVDFAATAGNAIVSAVPGLFTAVVIFYLARMLTRGLDNFFERVLEGEHTLAWLDADVAVPTRRIAKVLVWLFALAMAYPYLPGAGTEAFKGLSVLVGLMISLGASNLVGQAASGLILTYGRVYRKGEYVRLAEQEGTVTEMGMFATRIRTGLGEELTISNTSILAGTTKNYSRAVQGAGYVVDTTVTIGYDTPWRQVHAMLIDAAVRTEGILVDPPPQVFQTALSDWYPVYRLVCQAVPEEPRPRAMVLSALHANIQDVFNTFGVQIMSPQYIADPAHAKTVPPHAWTPAPAKPDTPAAPDNTPTP
ncbi:Small-conductance mechanosensitive channel [Curvibacter sp. AEP1-3]|uniref:mechanosensitive ion channel family protein n=1 Tax=Curvibacter sp. AEP1-3 TaxID=1844971 RepID=UPI000B3D4652|nr:mechanosensitive ion channel domain-containing protein [Curvibacter sp. AEP1-3]ARV18698.1 Small-conductance mechanosensitive channel [Curvibacter sp. AEP1-3]